MTQFTRTEKVTYKVWIEIEEYDEDTGVGENVDAPGASVATFATHEDAYAFAELLTDVADSVGMTRMRPKLAVSAPQPVALGHIAEIHLGIDPFRSFDDPHDCYYASLLGLREALIAAYQAGRAARTDVKEDGHA